MVVSCHGQPWRGGRDEGAGDEGAGDEAAGDDPAVAPQP